MTNPSDLDAIGQAQAIAKGHVSAAELLEAAIARAEAINPALNFLAQKLYDRARSAAPATGPFAGVPFLVKDLHVHIRGERSGEGSNLWRDYRPDYNSVLYDRILAAGFNTFGKTTSPELGLTVTTESAAYGLTRNPWHPDHSAGGSSGGSAVAVASGVVPMAQASDGGGSIRCPAAACGVFGLKPSRGRMPAGPHGTESWLGLTVVGAVSRSVRDNAAFLDAIHGAEPGSRYVAPAPDGSFLAAVARDPGRLRVALNLSPPAGTPVDPEIIAATRAAARLLESLGHHVEEAGPQLSGGELGTAMVAVLAGCTAADIANRLAEMGRDSAGDAIETVTQMYVHVGGQTSARQLLDANAAFQRAAITVARFQERYDVILSPVFAQPVIELGKVDLTDVATYTANVLTYSPFTALYNQTGQPAMSLPLGTDGKALPIGIMIAGRYGDEALLYALAGQLEAAAPWAQRRPPL
jgi:Asp-tRNA(Asn)/Glu-tRNA(Gln) amidotransferase A subunit family amidase